MKAFQKRSFFSGLTKNTFLLALTSLFADISSEMLYPILPIFLTQNLKASGSIVGIIEGIAETTQNIIQGFSGWLSDKWQKRKGIAVFGYVLDAINFRKLDCGCALHPLKNKREIINLKKGVACFMLQYLISYFLHS